MAPSSSCNAPLPENSSVALIERLYSKIPNGPANSSLGGPGRQTPGLTQQSQNLRMTDCLGKPLLRLRAA
jgi:hypothetical protein